MHLLYLLPGFSSGSPSLFVVGPKSATTMGNTTDKRSLPLLAQRREWRTAQVNLVALLLIFILPFAIVVYQLVAEINTSTNLARQERYGNTYLRPLQALMVSLPQHRLLAHRYLSTSEGTATLLQQQARLEADWQALAQVDRQLGNLLGTAAMQRQLQQNWQQLAAQTQTMLTQTAADPDLQQQHDRLIADLRMLIARVGDRSKLILDPDLDSYYLMDAVLLKLPERLDLLAQARQLGETALQQNQLLPEARGTLIALVGLLEANLSATRSGMRVALAQTLSPTLAAAIETPLAEAIASAKSFTNQLSHLIANDSAAPSAPAFDRAAAEAIDATFRFSSAAAAQLDRLIGSRIQERLHKTYTVEGFALLVLAAVVYFVVGFSRNLAARQQAQRRLSAQYATTRVLAEALTLDQATPSVLEAICNSLNWQVGELWSIDPTTQTLRLVHQWQAASIAAPELEQQSRSLSFLPGQGLPGQVWQQGAPLWIGDVAQDQRFHRGKLTLDFGLHAACGFPILCSDRVLGVMSFFSQSLQPVDPELLEMMGAIGTQVGQFMQRKQMETALQDTAHGVSAATGAAFFQTLVQKLSAALETDYAFVGELVAADKPKIKIVAIFAQGSEHEPFEYPLAGTPCQSVVGRDLRYYPAEVSQQFDQDPMLRELAVESYMGAPLFSSTGQPLGVLAVMSGAPLADQQLAESMLKIFATRAAAELERSRAEEALRQSEALQRMALNAARMGAWEWNVVTGEEHWSKEAEAIFGLPSHSFKGNYQDFLKLVHPHDREHVKQAQARTLYARAEYSPEYRIVRPDGTERWVSVRGSVVWDETDEPLRLIGVVMDITDRKRIELAMAESDRRLRQQSQALTRLARHEALTAGNLERALRVITEAAAESLRVERAIVWLYSSDRTQFICADLYERSLNRHSAELSLSVADYPDYFESLPSDRVIATDNIAEEPALWDFWESYFNPLGINASLDAPIIVGGQVVGLVCHEHVGEARQWTLTEQNFAGSIADFVSLALEVCERKRTEVALRQAEEKYRSIFENAVTGIFQTTLDGSYLSANPALARIYGYASVEDLMTNLTSIERQLYVDLNRRQEFIRLMAEQGFVSEFESQVYRCTGEVIWISENAIAVHNEQNHLLYYEGTVEDITAAKRLETERQRTERALQRQLAAIEASVDGISIVNPLGEFIYMNKAHAEIYGYNSPAELIGQHWAVVYDASELQRFEQEIMPKFAQEGQWRGEAIGKRRDGSTYPQEVSLTAVEGGGLVCIVQDITQRKRVEAALRDSKKAAEDANRAKSQFLANMSHELRTPLNAIIGYSEMLQEDAEDSGASDIVPDLEKIRGAGKHLLSLINDILDISKIEAGKMELYLETFDVATLLQEVQTTIAPLAEKNGNRMEVFCPGSIGTMHADLTKVRQVLLNLLSNAAKFTQSGTITLTVEVGELPHAASSPAPLPFLTFRVTDTGIGMSAEQIDRVFEAFTQADASTTRKYGGTGLGLAISRRFCQMMGGDITVTSQLGAGSTFTIYLPLEVAARSPVDPATPEPPQVEEARLASAPAAATLLVIDDDHSVRELMTRYLTKEGFRVETAATAEAGLQLARQLRPDAITLDVLLPGADGWTALSQLKADPDLADTPVIVMTIVDDKNLGFALGATDYLTKPIDYRRMTQMLSRYRSKLQAGHSGQVLIVEDDAATRSMFRRILAREGWTVSEAANGRLAIDQLRAAAPDLILLDLMMPEMDGFQFVAAVRQNQAWRSLPIIVITAMDIAPGDRLALNGSVEQILQKSAHSRDALLREIRDLVTTCIRHQPSRSQHTP